MGMTMRKVIVTDLDGTRTRYGSLTECGEALGLTADSVWKRVNGIVKGEKRKFEYEVTPPPRKKKEVKPKPQGYKKRPFVPGNNKVIEYETKGTRVCITPCRYRDNILVGSAACQNCRHFKGMDREKHLVACAHKGKHDILK